MTRHVLLFESGDGLRTSPIAGLRRPIPDGRFSDLGQLNDKETRYI